MIIHNLTVRLTNIFQRYCFEPVAAAAEAQPIIDDLFDSLGGCDLCFGRGYTIQIALCTCKRGKDLESFIKNYKAMPETHLADKRVEDV